MTVGEFQTLLVELGRFLRGLKANGAAKEVEELGAKLAGFKDYKLKPFGELLVKTEEYIRLGPVPRSGGGGRSVKKDPAAVDRACLQLVQLNNQAIDPNTTVEAIEEAVKALEALNPTKAKLEDLARQIGLAQKFKTKADIIKAVRQRILSIKGVWDRKDA